MTFIERTENEFGEPFADVLQGFADMGYGCNTTARMLDYDISGFRVLPKRHGIIINWPTAERRIDAYDRNPWPGCKAMINTRKAMSPLYTHPDTGEAMTASEWAKRLDISCSWFVRRIKKHGLQRRSFLPSLRRMNLNADFHRGVPEAEKNGICYKTYWNRIFLFGWDWERAATQRPEMGRKPVKSSVSQQCRVAGIPRKTYYNTRDRLTNQGVEATQQEIINECKARRRG